MWENGKFYEGNFQNDRIIGNGRFIHVDGGFYEGDIYDGLAHGKGLYRFPDGE
jgi:hypothetical protein